MTEPADGPAGVIPFDRLPHTRHSHELIGADHGDLPFSIILVHSAPGVGPAIHRHPYPEVFVVEDGEATFQLGEERLVVSAGHVVVGPSDVPHGFVNSGSGELRLVAIHGAGRFVTDWLGEADADWVSPGKGR
ncbi:MAG TPA: cupin domain-containing protein [Candidatus Limnocylindrales bacterium]|jgi:quercetin dioxygenase-like cupin family protein